MSSKAYIKDSPAKAIRGVTIDATRNIITAEDMTHHVDVLRRVKVNRLTVRVASPAGHVLEGKRAPLLALYGAREGSMALGASEMARAVAHAAALGVEVVPEVALMEGAGMAWGFGESVGMGQLAVCAEDLCTTGHVSGYQSLHTVIHCVHIFSTYLL